MFSVQIFLTLINLLWSYGNQPMRTASAFVRILNNVSQLVLTQKNRRRLFCRILYQEVMKKSFENTTAFIEELILNNYKNHFIFSLLNLIIDGQHNPPNKAECW